LVKLKSGFTDTKFDSRLQEKTEKGKRMEETREQLNMELRTLSLQADSRARLDVKRAEVRSKTNEAGNT
jgi:DNA repair protein RAD50